MATTFATLATRAAGKPNHMCGVEYAAQILGEMGEADDFRAALANRSVTHVEIRAAAELLGVRLGIDTLSRHRGGKCGCGW